MALNGCGPNLCFPKAFGQMPDFHIENPATCHLVFAAKTRHCCALGDLGDMGCDNHTRMGASKYIYLHHAQCKHTK